ncbi:hypothetical protein Tco_0489518 [Tanacetum coccineum]
MTCLQQQFQDGKMKHTDGEYPGKNGNSGSHFNGVPSFNVKRLNCCSNFVNGFESSVFNAKSNEVILGIYNDREIRKNDDLSNAHKVFDEMSMNKFLKCTVNEYYDAFNSLFQNKRFDEWYLIDLFIFGLQSEIEKTVKMFKPKSLLDDYHLDSLQESANIIMKKIFNTSLSLASKFDNSKEVEKESNQLVGYEDCCKDNVDVKSKEIICRDFIALDELCEENSKEVKEDSIELVFRDDEKDNDVKSSGVVINNCGLKVLDKLCEEKVEGIGMK